MTAMTVRRVLAVASVVFAMAPPAWAQPPAPPPAASVPAPTRAAWFEHYQDTRKGPEATDTYTRTFKVGAGASLDIYTLAGTIVVEGAPGDEIVINAVKRVRAPAADARALMDGIVIEANETAGRVEVRTGMRRAKYGNVWVDYTVQVPFGAAVSARSLAGDIKVVNVRGDVQIECTSGTAEANLTPSLVRVKSISGDILLNDAGSSGTLAASTVSGRLVAKGLKARALEFTSISGDVVLLDVISERVQARTVNGEVEFLGGLSKSGRYEFVSHSGDIRLRLTMTSGFELSATTFSGDVRSDLPIKFAPSDTDLPPGVPRPHDVRGTFGDGSALVTVKTFSGSVVLVRAEADKGRAKGKPDKKSPEK
jgi:DUF4097 and DUF4098 domain-containing protein YvlB